MTTRACPERLLALTIDFTRSKTMTAREFNDVSTAITVHLDSILGNSALSKRSLVSAMRRVTASHRDICVVAVLPRSSASVVHSFLNGTHSAATDEVVASAIVRKAARLVGATDS